jgi:hypothetical protein
MGASAAENIMAHGAADRPSQRWDCSHYGVLSVGLNDGKVVACRPPKLQAVSISD